jgi:hypothetical protein
MMEVLDGILEGPRKVEVRLPGKGYSNSHGARPVHLILTIMKWIRTAKGKPRGRVSPAPSKWTWLRVEG